MQRVNEFVFYELAMKIHALTEVDSPLKYGAVWLDWWHAREAVDEIYRQRSLNFTTPSAWRLYQAITAIVPKDWNQVIAKLPTKPSQR